MLIIETITVPLSRLETTMLEARTGMYESPQQRGCMLELLWQREASPAWLGPAELASPTHFLLSFLSSAHSYKEMNNNNNAFMILLNFKKKKTLFCLRLFIFFPQIPM